MFVSGADWCLFGTNHICGKQRTGSETGTVPEPAQPKGANLAIDSSECCHVNAADQNGEQH